MFKRILSLFLAIVMMFGVTTTAFAQVETKDSKVESFDISSKMYLGEDGIVMIPLREVLENMEYNVQWIGETNTVVVSKDENSIELKIGENSITVNEEIINMDSKIIIKDGKTFVPVEFFSNVLDLVVGLDEKYGRLNIRPSVENAEEFFTKSKSEEITNNLNAYMNALQKVENFSGSILVAKDDQILLTKGYGLSNINQNISNKAQTKFAIGSITKQFVAMGIMQLVESGSLNLDHKVSKYIEDFPNGDLLTIENLLTHTSGLVNVTNLPEFYQVALTNKNAREILDLIISQPLLFNPGEAFDYSNTNYLLLGMIIENISGMSYEEYLQKNIFDVVGMNDTGIAYGNDNNLYDATAYTGYLELTAVDDEMLLKGAYGAGSMYSTVEDLYRWDQALKTEKLVKNSTLNEIFKERVAMGDGSSYGYGWMISNSGIGKILLHGGNTLGFTSNLVNFMDLDLTIIILSNVGSYYNINNLTNTLLSIVLGAPYVLPEPRVEIKLENEELTKFVGEYELQPGFICTIMAEGEKIYAQLTGQPAAEIFPYSQTEFFYKLVDAQITFNKNEEGLVTGLVLNQAGIQMPGNKIK